LEKDPRRRLSSIGDARLELEEAASTTNEEHLAKPVPAIAIPIWHRILPWAVAAAGFLAALACLLLWQPWHVAPAAVPVRLNAEIGADAALETNIATAAVISGAAWLHLRAVTITWLAGLESTPFETTKSIV